MFSPARISSGAPEIAVIRSGLYTPVKSFALDGGAQAQAISNVEQITWTSFDGLEIQGWLLLSAQANRLSPWS